MRTSREWIERTVADLDRTGPSAIKAEVRHLSVRPGPRGARALTLEITLSEEEVRALDAICLEDELTPKQALANIVRARLLDRPQFGRGDRARLRACVELLRAMEQHVGRAARPVSVMKPTLVGVEHCAGELVELGAYLRRIGRAIGESMLGNLDFWRGGSES
jgi:hypothetical protein